VERFALWRWERLLEDWQLIAAGLGRTVATAGLALLLSLALGVLFGLLATAPWRPARILNRLYVGMIQNIPLVTLFLFFFYALGHFKLYPEAMTIGVVGLGIYHGAYMSEVVRAGIQAVHRGQLEAAFSQGFTYPQAMRYVILPQTIQVVLPPLTNQAVSLIKNSSVLAMISGYDLMHTVDSWVAETGHYGPGYLVVGLLYFLLCFPLATLARRWEERAAKARGEVRAQ
jgi:putative glutamine transport system permease protein